jgi:hypothetical protein
MYIYKKSVLYKLEVNKLLGCRTNVSFPCAFVCPGTPLTANSYIWDILKLLFYVCIFEFSVCGLELKHDVVVVMRLLWLQLLQRKKIVSFPFIYIWAQHLLYK